MMVTESYENNEDKHRSTTEVILHNQHNDKLYMENFSPNVKDKSINASEQTNGVGGGQHDDSAKNVGRNGAYPPKTANNSSIINNQRGPPVSVNHISPARNHQLNQRRRNHRRGFSADRGDSKSSSNKTETPPSSQALQRRLIVDRKQCVYSDLPKRNQFGSDGATLYKKSLQNKTLNASKSHEKVVVRTDMSISSMATTSVEDTTKNKVVPPSYRRQSLHTVIQRESPLRRGALSSKYASSNLSRSSLSSGSISQSNLLSGMPNVLPNSPIPKDENSPPPRDAPLYERLKWCHEYDEMSHRDVALGRRIGFYKIKSDLGSGNFSKVKLANHQLTKERVAVKIIDKGKLDSKTHRMVSREIQITDTLSHPHLIRLYEVIETISGIHLILEYAHGGELFARLTSEKGPYKESEAKIVFAQISSAIQYMHEKDCIHRDLKAENVFFASASENCLDVKVGDFGFATQVSTIDQHLNTFCGSPPYAAPELFQDDHYLGPSVDIWALGVLLYFMVTGTMPFKGSTVAALKKSILDGRFELPIHLSDDCMDMIKSILKRKASWRLTLNQIKDSRWLQGVHWPLPDRNYQSLPRTSFRPEASILNRDRNSFETINDTVHNGNNLSQNVEDNKILSKEDICDKNELLVRNEMQGLGIPSNLINSHIERGARSPIIGTYRILLHRLMLYGNVKEDITTGNGEKRNDQYISNVNGNTEAFSNKKSDHNSWWNSQSSSSRFSSPASKSESRNFVKNGGRPTLNAERGRISRNEIISSPMPNNFPAEDSIDGRSNGNDKNLKYDVNPRKNKKSKTCNIL